MTDDKTPHCIDCGAKLGDFIRYATTKSYLRELVCAGCALKRALEDT